MPLDEESGLICSVYRASRFPNCTNGGVTATAEDVLLILPGGGPFSVADVGDRMPVVKLVRRGNHLCVEPVKFPRTGSVGYMMGGNFIWTSDSRFPNEYPLPVHDRQETYDQYLALSR
jgi:hypothetical protein